MNSSNNETPVIGAGNAPAVQNNATTQNQNIMAGFSVASAQNGGNLALANSEAAQSLGMILVSKQCPRDELKALEKIEKSCTRLSFAEHSQYALARGGTNITGATVGLVRAIADYWGNITSGSRITESNSARVKGYAFAWDMETNRRVEVPFDVPLVRYTKQGVRPLVNPDDIRYLVNNYASRSERSALERVIPTDVVQFALDKCLETQKANVKNFKPESLLEAFAEFEVTKDDIEKFCQRKLESLGSYPGYIVRLRQILLSLRDGIAKKEDFFKDSSTDAPGASDNKDAGKDEDNHKSRANVKNKKTIEDVVSEKAAEVAKITEPIEVAKKGDDVLL